MASITHELPIATRKAIWRKSFWRHARIPAVFMGAFLLVCVLSLPYLSLDARSNNMTVEISRLSNDRDELRRSVSELQRQLAVSQSLAQVAKRATALGLQEKDEVNVLALDYQGEEDDTSRLGVLAGGLSQLRSLLAGSSDGAQ